MYPDEIVRYYNNPKVKNEIYEFSLNRWVASEASSNTKRIFIRYWRRNGPPLSFNSLSAIDRFFYHFKKLNPRTFYASINTYQSLSSREDTTNIDNIVSSSPVWDVDGDLSYYEYILKAAEIIVEGLQKHGLYKSIYLIWSGRGIHIHINENAFSKDLLKKHHPLNLSYAVVEYILRISKRKLLELFSKIGSSKREFKVENKIDIQRVFTVPLSLHRFLDYSAVCFKPDEIDNFDLSWTEPNNFRHNPDWRVFITGEADELGEKAVKAIGEYLPTLKIRGRRKSSVIETVVAKTPVIQGNIGRFQVMALLQAARYYILKGDTDMAMSFGLNRAIFYAWAKYHKVRQWRKKMPGTSVEIREKYEVKSFGDENVFLSPNGMFIIGDKEQTPEDYRRRIIKKINVIIPYDIAWKTALNYIKRFPDSILLCQKDFYEKVYLPVRDNFKKLIQEYLTLTNYERLKRNEEKQ